MSEPRPFPSFPKIRKYLGLTQSDLVRETNLQRWQFQMLNRGLNPLSDEDTALLKKVLEKEARIKELELKVIQSEISEMV